MTATNTTPSIFRLFYTHRRSQILLEAKGIRVQRIEKVGIVKPNGEFFNCVHVVYIVKNGGRCSTFISCKDYLQRAIEKRKTEAQNYTARQDFNSPSEWRVYSKPNPNSKKIEAPRQIEENDAPKFRTVHTTPDVVFCDCPDFNEQSSYLSQHPYLWEKVIKQFQVCKHIFITLQTLGYQSLSDYFKSWKTGGKLNNLSITMNKTSRRTA